MLKVWKRKNWFYNLILSIYYLFLVFQNAISFCSIGWFYAAYSIFLREAFPSSRWTNSFQAANILENLYILSLLLLLFLWTSADVKYLNIEFWIFSFIFSIFSLLLIGWSIYYAFGSTISLITILLFGLYVLTYIIPIIWNWGSFRISTLIQETSINTIIKSSSINPSQFQVYKISLTPYFYLNK